MALLWKKTIRCTSFSQSAAHHLQSSQRGGSLINLYVKNLRKFMGRKKRSNGLSSNWSIESNGLPPVVSVYRESVGADVSWTLIQPGHSNRLAVAAFRAWFVAFLAMGSKRMVVAIMLVVFLLLLQLLFISGKFLRKELKGIDIRTKSMTITSLKVKRNSEICA